MKAVSDALVVLSLILLLGLQPITTDLYLPALPLFSEALQATPEQAQRTLFVLLLAFGCSQLLWGALSDRVGRRPVLLSGLLLYLGSATLAWRATGIEVLLAARLLQGVALGGLVMGARALLRDRYDVLQGAQLLSRSLSGVGVLAALAVPAGSLVVGAFGWRAPFVVHIAFAAVALYVVLRYLPESAGRRSAPSAWRSVGQVAASLPFWGFSALGAASYTGLYTLLASSPYVLMQGFGWSRARYGMAMLACSSCFIGGTVLCRHVLRRHGLLRTLALGGVLSLAGGGLAFAAPCAGETGVSLLLGGAFLYMLAHGIHLTCAQTGAVAPFPQQAGMAAAMNGCLMMLVVFAAGTVLGGHMDDKLSPLSHSLAACGAVVCLLACTVPRVACWGGR